MDDILKIVKRGYSVQFDFDIDKNEYIVSVEDRTGPEGSINRRASRRVPLCTTEYETNYVELKTMTPDDIFFAVVECVGYVKGPI